MDNNICKFLSTKKHDSSLNVINLVCEKEANFKSEFIIPSTYALAFVTEGQGMLHTNAGDFALSAGDMFMTFPAKPYYIENVAGLKYIYVSFIGTKADALIARLKISYTEPIFYDFAFLKENFESTFELSNDNNVDLFCESLLLYSLAFICHTNEETVQADKINNLLLAKEYVDINFTDCNLDLKVVSQKFSYSAKYFSMAFKRLVKINFSQYLKIKRLDFAITLIDGGVTNVNELAEMCGYKDATYFSKCFKERYGVSPKKWGQNK